MDHNDRLLEHVETLEHQTERLMQYTRTVKRLLRWWRGAACGLAMLHLLSLVLPSRRATYDQKDLEHRVAELEYKLEYVSGGANEVVITGANLRIINGLGSTATTNGLGNLIVGYNEPRDIVNVETGSHNVVVGQKHNFHTPPDLVVTSQSSQNTLALSIPYPHPVSSAPMTSDRGMRHGTRRQTDTPQPYDHRQLPR
jgi:hypothetical protein